MNKVVYQIPMSMLKGQHQEEQVQENNIQDNQDHEEDDDQDQVFF